MESANLKTAVDATTAAPTTFTKSFPDRHID